MSEIKVNNGNIEDALKRFKRQCARNGVLQEVRKREHYEKSGRQDLIDQINEEIEILSEYLPKPLSTEEIEKIVEEIITSTGASSMKDMGIVMKEAKAKIGPAADGKTINEIVKAKLN